MRLELYRLLLYPKNNLISVPRRPHPQNIFFKTKNKYLLFNKMIVTVQLSSVVSSITMTTTPERMGSGMQGRYACSYNVGLRASPQSTLIFKERYESVVFSYALESRLTTKTPEKKHY
jgi:nitrous oxide reductase accessory protein NosL